ncbi:hypothetical protein Hdeb2414_s0004g00130821 [Helianthus debilis subsp. tardiflorus]
MLSNSSTLHVTKQEIPVFFKGDSFELWSIKMKTLFKSEGLWDIVQTDYAEASDDKIRQKDFQTQDAKALLFIQQAVDKSIFSRIAAATSAKQAWSLLKTMYQGSKQELKPVEDMDVDINVQSLLDFAKRKEDQIKHTAPSIYMVPSTLRDQNVSSFTPRMVSIGPLHREDENLQANEGEKATHMLSLLNRLPNFTPEVILQACFRKVISSIHTIRSCYAGTITYNNMELANMMVMDGCFILEFLYRSRINDPSQFENKMFLQFTMYDLLLLENQIPFLVLEDIFECTISKFDRRTSLISVIHEALRQVNPFKTHKLKSTNTTPHHMLGLLHECYVYDKAVSSEFPNSRFPSVVELDRAGVNFMPLRDADWPLMMEVKSRRLPCISCSWGKPSLIMPVLDIDDFTGLVLKNLIAYELYSKNISPCITSYAIAMDMLIDTEEDIAKLVESKVLVNHIGTNQEAADMINSICKEVAWRDFFYFKQWTELNRHYNSYWSRNLAWLRRTYFNNPWNFIALLAASALFILTFLQTFYTINPV